MKLEIGNIVLVRLSDGGAFVATVERFERDGNVAVLMPTRDPVRAVFPNGYELGQAHWDSMLELL